MPAATHQVHLSEPSNAFVHEQAESSGYASPSDFIQNLVEEARLEKAYQAEIEAKVLEAVHSEHPGFLATPKYWAEKRARLQARLDKARQTAQ